MITLIFLWFNKNGILLLYTLSLATISTVKKSHADRYMLCIIDDRSKVIQRAWQWFHSTFRYDVTVHEWMNIISETRLRYSLHTFSTFLFFIVSCDILLCFSRKKNLLLLLQHTFITIKLPPMLSQHFLRAIYIVIVCFPINGFSFLCWKSLTLFTMSKRIVCVCVCGVLA